MATLELRSRRSAGDPKRDGLIARLRGSRPVQTVLATGLVVVAVIVLCTTLLIVDLRGREIEEAKRNLVNINNLVAENASRSLESVDLVLENVTEELRLRQPNQGIVEQLRTDRPFHESLRNRVTGLPQLAAISLVGPDGRLISFSRSFPIPEIDLSDRDHFRTLKEGKAAEPFLSEPLRNRGTGEWSVYLARRITGPDGALVAIVYAAIDLNYFARSYASLVLRPGSALSLWQFDGTLLLRQPPIDAIGRRFDTPAFRGLTAASPPMVYENPASIDGRAKLVARHVIPDFRMVSAIALPMENVLSDWKQEAAILAAAGALLSVAAAFVMIAVMRQFWAYEALAAAERDRAAAISGMGELQEQLRQSQKLEVMGQLTSGVAHDFNNLLTVVIGNLDRLMRRVGDEQPELARYVENARSGADRAAGLCQRLLAFSRRQPLEPRLLDVNAIVSGLETLLQQTLGRKAMLRLDLTPGLPQIFADPGGMESALLNLVVNARDAMPGGGTITISTGAERDLVCITVADTGTGMSAEVLQRAFEPFFTTKAPGVGTGLGLAQVYGFARQSGGDVTIDSREGEGTRVAFCLPPADGLPPSDERPPADLRAAADERAPPQQKDAA